jgi:hypothetical protein
MKSKQIKLPLGDKRFLEGFRSKGQHSAREIDAGSHSVGHGSWGADRSDSKGVGCQPHGHLAHAIGLSGKGLDYAVYDAARPGQPAKYGTDQEAEVVALACSQAPEGATRWTVRLLDDRRRDTGPNWRGSIVKPSARF